MKIISDTKLIKRNKKIGQYTTFAALAVLGIGLYYSFTQPEQISITFGALLLGFIMTQVGIYFSNRWGKSPRPDEVITAALKGLENQYSLYHYTAGVPHLLAGPTGVWGIIPVSVGGTIKYDETKMRFRQKGGNFYFKLFGQENLGRPEAEAQYVAADFAKFVKKNFPDVEIPEIQTLIVFTNKNAILEVTNSPFPTVTLEKLKEFIRKSSKSEPAQMAAIQTLQNALPAPEK